jgi:hypothetical protein
MEIRLHYCSKSIPEQVATTMMDELLQNMTLLVSSAPDTKVSQNWAPCDKCLPIPALNDRASPFAGDAALRSETLNHANMRIREAVIDAWKEVLGPKFEAATAGDPLLHIPFYDLWGDMVVASQLAVLYRKFGVEVAVEEIIQRPTMAQHMHILGDSLGERC